MSNPHNDSRLRARQLPIPADYWQPASTPNNAITDVPGVRVGHVTLDQGSGPLQPGTGPIRTGVTVVLPHPGNLFQDKVIGAAHVLNGFGKACGLIQVQELGEIETPIALTNTLSVWRVAEAVARWSIARNPAIGITTSTVNPIAAECNDGDLNDIQGNHIRTEDVIHALEDAINQNDLSFVAEGNVGGGTGMTCYGWKGGIGTAGRTVEIDGQTYTLGALVQANFGRTGQLTFAGVRLPTWRDLYSQAAPAPPGSVVVILATDAPLESRQLQRLCVRAGAGLARTGSTIDHGSGDFVIAFSVARRISHLPRASTDSSTLIASSATDPNPPELPLPTLNEAQAMHALFPAVVEAVEESVLNALCAAQTMTGRDDRIRYALPLDMVEHILAK